LNAKKLEGFVSRIKLITPPVNEIDEEGNQLPTPADLPLKAIVRVRIPLKRPINESQQ
jgi:hypothetical protein